MTQQEREWLLTPMEADDLRDQIEEAWSQASEPAGKEMAAAAKLMTARQLMEASPEERDRYMREAADNAAPDYEPGGPLHGL